MFRLSVLFLVTLLTACSTQPEGPVVPVNSYNSFIGGGHESTK